MVKKIRVTKGDMLMKLVTVKDLKKFKKFCKFFQNICVLVKSCGSYALGPYLMGSYVRMRSFCVGLVFFV